MRLPEHAFSQPTCLVHTASSLAPKFRLLRGCDTIHQRTLRQQVRQIGQHMHANVVRQRGVGKILA